MSKLYGRINTDAAKNEVTRRGHRSMSATLETWQGKIRLELDDSGVFQVTVSGKHGEDAMTLAYGNVDKRTVSAAPFFPAERGSNAWEIESVLRVPAELAEKHGASETS